MGSSLSIGPATNSVFLLAAVCYPDRLMEKPTLISLDTASKDMDVFRRLPSNNYSLPVLS
jgi:hypothetical protein